MNEDFSSHKQVPKKVLAETLAALSPAKRALLEQKLINKKKSQTTGIQTISVHPNQNAAPLSFAQQRLWFLDQLEEAKDTHNMSISLRLTGMLDVAILEQSLSEIIRRHESLRTSFQSKEADTFQQVDPPFSVKLPVLKIHNNEEAEKIVIEDLQQAFNLKETPLLRFSLLSLTEDSHFLLATKHHIISDGWSIKIFIHELSVIYNSLSKNKPHSLADLPIQYADFSYWQHQKLSGKTLETLLDYWKKQLKGAPPLLELPTDRPRPPIQTYRGAKQHLQLSLPLFKALKEFSNQANVTLYTTLLSAFKLLLHRYSGQTDIVIGTPIAGRNHVEIEKLIGLFISTQVLRTDLSGNPSFQELLRRTQKVALEAYEHQDLPFEKLVEALRPERNLSYTPLFQVWFNMFNMVNQEQAPAEPNDLNIERFSLNDKAPAQFDLTLYVREKEQSLGITLLYNVDLFDASRMEEMLNQFNVLLTQIVENSHQKIADYSLLTPQAKLVLPDPRQTLNNDCHETVITKFSKQSELSANDSAIQDSQNVWTYAELDARSNQLAHYLSSQKIESQNVVAIYAHRDASLAWAIMGVLKAGAAFVILDPAYPESRLINYLQITQPQGLLTLEMAGDLPAELKEFVSNTLSLKAQLYDCSIESSAEQLSEHSTHACPIEIKADNLAYITFTSGSTGTPKAVLTSHQPLAHFLEWYQQRFEFSASDRFNMLSGLSHDPLLRDIFAPLVSGAMLCIPEPKIIENPPQLLEWMRDSSISISHLTPAMGQLLTNTAENAALEPINSLRYAFFGGDVLTTHDTTTLKTVFPSVTCINFYGATETPQAVSFFIATEVEETAEAQEKLTKKLPIGQGIDNAQLLVLNTHQQLAGIGEEGEIYVRTPYLAKGYLNDDALTQQQFINNPFTNIDSDKVYKTGDLARYLPNGHVQFYGRKDHQVKLRGFRIELGEIEAVLHQHASVEKVVVIDNEDASGEKRLLAYLILSNSQEAIDSNALREFIKEKLPSYMIPSNFITLDEIPLTPNGKVDRKGLPVPDVESLSSEFVAPRTDTEEKLASIWSEILKLEDVGIHDNFFELGGHSLLAISLLAQIEKSFDTEGISMMTIFQAPTIAQFATILHNQHQSNTSTLALLTIQPQGTKPPLFFIGSPNYSRTLIPSLGADQPIYGLNIFGLQPEDGSTPELTIESIARQYVQDIQTVQAEGPYYFCAYCADSRVAYEMSQQLQAQGKTVALLVFIDAVWRTSATAQQNIYSRFWNNLLEFGPEYFIYKIQEKIKFYKDKALLNADDLEKQKEQHEETGEVLPLNVQHKLLVLAYKQAMRDYKPQPYSGDISLFLSYEWRSKNTSIIAELVNDRLDVHELDAYHRNIFEPEKVKDLGELLKSCLEKKS